MFFPYPKEIHTIVSFDIPKVTFLSPLKAVFGRPVVHRSSNALGCADEEKWDDDEQQGEEGEDKGPGLAAPWCSLVV